MTITADDIKAIADAVHARQDTGEIAADVVARLTENPPPFWVAGEQHYNDHRRLTGFFRFWDGIVKAASVVVISAFVMGALYIIAVGLHVK